MKTDAIIFYEGSCQGRLSNTPREQSKHRWREGDGLKLIEKVINRTDIHLVYWGEDRTELVTAEIKVELKWSNFTNLIPSLSDHSHGECQIHVQTWSMTNPGGTSIQLWFCSWNTAEPTGLSLKALLTPLPAHSGWLDKDIQKVAMIHWLIHHPSMLKSMTAFPP